MKVDESSSSVPPGDISPLNTTISNLPEASKADGKKPAKKSEPTFERLQNLSRVTPQQLPYISFPADGRYQPVRPVTARPQSKSAKNKGAASPVGSGQALGSTIPVTTDRAAWGGGILLLIDTKPGEPAEYIEAEVPVPAVEMDAVPQVSEPVGSVVGPSHISLDEHAPEAEPPEPFEVRRP